MRAPGPIAWLALGLASCGDGPAPARGDSAPEAAPEACEPFALEAWQTWESADLPQIADPSGPIHGGALGDLDGDGDLDLLLAYAGGGAVFTNDGAGALAIDDSKTIDGSPWPSSNSAALADLDGDGDLDGWLGRPRGDVDQLIYNDGTGVFSPRPLEGSEPTPGTGSFADFDGDGDLDLFVSGFVENLDIFAVQAGTQIGEGTALWLNEGEVFVDATDRLPPEVAPAIGFQGTILDADADGDLDIYMGNDVGAAVPANQLLINDGAANFSLAEECHCELAMASMGSGMGDANHDGLPDVLISDFGPPALLLGQGDGTFVEAAAAMGADVPLTDDHATGWGTAFVDLNGDTCMDMVLLYGECCRSSDEFIDSEIQYDQILFGDCDGGFTRAEPHEPTFVSPDRSRSIVIGDLDGDLRPDLVVIGKHFVRTWLNRGGCPAGLAISLDAGAGNRQGLGAKVAVEVDGWTTTQWMLPATASSSSAPELYFGLGGWPTADRVEVTWPDGAIEVFEDVPAGTRVTWSR